MLYPNPDPFSQGWIHIQQETYQMDLDSIPTPTSSSGSDSVSGQMTIFANDVSLKQFELQRPSKEGVWVVWMWCSVKGGEDTGDA